MHAVILIGLLSWIRSGDEPIEKPQESLTSEPDSARGRFQGVEAVRSINFARRARRGDSHYCGKPFRNLQLQASARSALFCGQSKKADPFAPDVNALYVGAGQPRQQALGTRIQHSRRNAATKDEALAQGLVQQEKHEKTQYTMFARRPIKTVAGNVCNELFQECLQACPVPRDVFVMHMHTHFVRDGMMSLVCFFT